MKKWLVKILFILVSMLPLTNSQLYAQSTKQAPIESTDTLSMYESIFARVNEVTISEATLKQFFAQEYRSRFYHGKPPEGEILSFEKEIRDLLIEYYLSAQAASELAFKSNEAKIAQQIVKYQARFKENPQWQSAKVKFLPMYRQLLTIIDLATQYQAYIRDNISLTNEEVRAYHQSHMDKFTQPPQNHVAVIMLNVSASAGGFVWKAVQEQVSDIYQKLKSGADFATLAELHSTDVTAEQGGDMGFIHQGMTAASVENLLTEMEPGDITEPQILLDGIAIFKLIARKPAIKHTFEDVEKRASILALTDAKEAAWQSAKDKLIQDAKISIKKKMKEVDS